jgi:hypothetical protein
MLSYCFMLVKALVVVYLVLLAYTVHQLMHPSPCRFDALLQAAAPGSKEQRRFERLRHQHCLDPFWPSSDLRVDLALHLGAGLGGHGDGDSRDGGASCRSASPLVTPGNPLTN